MTKDQDIGNSYWQGDWYGALKTLPAIADMVRASSVLLRCAREIHREMDEIVDQSENAAHVRIGDGCAVVL
jgi:hypothetical protein